ncbi:ADPATP carrier protein 1 chloroplastic [Zea mays]|uniref:ADP,ATP carrier protein n=2 Tax=Zea mays TaxID=4577 RepID=A0A1D6MKD5_MAIZE|nr:ADPATP carrier protein 1 chloroplastic [Zea mays]
MSSLGSTDVDDGNEEEDGSASTPEIYRCHSHAVACSLSMQQDLQSDTDEETTKITPVDEAKKLYLLFGLGANVAIIFSGRTMKYFSNLRKTLGPGMMSIVVLLELASIGE